MNFQNNKDFKQFNEKKFPKIETGRGRNTYPFGHGTSGYGRKYYGNENFYVGGLDLDQKLIDKKVVSEKMLYE